MFVQLEVTIKKTVQVEVDENVCDQPILQAQAIAECELFDPSFMDELSIAFLEQSPNKFKDIQEIYF